MSSVIIHGLGLSGMSALKYHLSAGFDVYFIEDDIEKCDKAVSLGAEKYHEHYKLKDVEYVIKSPGISLKNQYNQLFIDAGYKITSDICVFNNILKNKFPDSYVVGITGTNGKSTTVSLVNHMLNFNGIESYIGGNYGIPVFDMPIKNAKYILEISSYQLEISDDLNLNISALTNISPDHIEFHGSMEKYCNAKEKIFKGSDNAVICIDDYISKNIAIKISESEIKTVFASKNDIHPYEKFENLYGDHNNQNASMAYKIGRILKIPSERIYESFESFKGLRHRQHCIHKNKNTKFINDSKATNLLSCISALKVFDNIHLILGGLYKGEPLFEINKYKSKIKMIYIIGQEKNIDNILEEFKNSCVEIPYIISNTLDNAVTYACEKIKNHKDDGLINTLLLSPACASFDQYENFEKRGEHFEEIIFKSFLK